MKKLISALLCLSLLFAFVGCSKNEVNNEQQPTEQAVSQKMETIINSNEYVILQNIYYNDQAADYVDKDVSKKGIFTILYDEYNSCERYYVWGYNDNTKCCDWQWEIAPDTLTNLPTIGSTITVSGKFVANEKALDKYWIENPIIEITNELAPSEFDVDTTTMGGTLERVQLANMQAHADKFEGKAVTVYGRIESPNTVQHPYYDNCFSQEFESDVVLATGSRVVVSGTYSNGVITNASVKESTDF